jgi:diguanylate cyclase
MDKVVKTDGDSVATHQALRLRRVVMGAVSYLFTLSMVVVCWWLGFFRFPVLLNYFVAVLVLNVVFYLAIRSNFNLRFADPSMTLAQICSAILIGLYVMYYAQQARGALLLLCASAAMYGLFKFRTRDYIIMSGLLVGGYAILIPVVYIVKPNEIVLQIELLQLCALAATFVQFSGLGAYIGGLRDKLRQNNKELAARNDDLEHALRRIEELAMRDELTGVFNRRYLMETIKNEKHRCERSGAVFSICILDVDLFKHVNDTYGHLVGDEVLQAIARTASGALRQTDYFGRYGGEEFALVLTGTMAEGAFITAERVRTRIEALRFVSINDALKVTVSIGIADSNFNEETAMTFKRADEALYKAKQTGRNRCIIATPAMPKASVSHIPAETK